MTVDHLTADELTVDDLTWYQLFWIKQKKFQQVLQIFFLFSGNSYQQVDTKQLREALGLISYRVASVVAAIN